MRHSVVGASGLVVSELGLGCSNFGRRLGAREAADILHAAVDRGVTLFDTADTYDGGESEELLGRAIRDRRDRIVLATKWGHVSSSCFGPAVGARGGRSYIRRAVEASLRRLGTDYIDLYQMHSPDPETPIAETLSALADLVTEGKIRYIGSSNHPAWQIARAAHTAKELGVPGFVAAQDEWSLLERGIEAETVPAAAAYGIGVLAYFPLANGLLTGAVHRGAPPRPGTRLAQMPGYVTDRKLELVERLDEWARRRGRTLLEVAIGSLAAETVCASVVFGATSVEQLERNLDAGEWRPDAAELAEIRAITAED